MGSERERERAKQIEMVKGRKKIADGIPALIQTYLKCCNILEASKKKSPTHTQAYESTTQHKLVDTYFSHKHTPSLTRIGPATDIQQQTRAAVILYKNAKTNLYFIRQIKFPTFFESTLFTICYLVRSFILCVYIYICSLCAILIHVPNIFCLPFSADFFPRQVVFLYFFLFVKLMLFGLFGKLKEIGREGECKNRGEKALIVFAAASFLLLFFYFSFHSGMSIWQCMCVVCVAFCSCIGHKNARRYLGEWMFPLRPHSR